jgi:hypothetical protein
MAKHLRATSPLHKDKKSVRQENSYRIEVERIVSQEKAQMSKIAQQIVDVLNPLPSPLLPPTLREGASMPPGAMDTLEKLVIDFTGHMSTIQGYLTKDLRRSSSLLTNALADDIKWLPATKDDLKEHILTLLSFEVVYDNLKPARSSTRAFGPKGAGVELKRER